MGQGTQERSLDKGAACPVSGSPAIGEVGWLEIVFL